MYYDRYDEENGWDSIYEAYRQDEDFYVSEDGSIDGYLNLGLDPAEARRWRDIDCPVFQTRWFRGLGVTPEQAYVLQTHPNRAWAYLSTGLPASEAKEWMNHGFEPEEVDVWWRAGWSPAQAHLLRRLHYGVTEAAIVWAFTGLAPEDALAKAGSGHSPVPFLPLPHCEPSELEAAPRLE